MTGRGEIEGNIRRGAGMIRFRLSLQSSRPEEAGPAGKAGKQGGLARGGARPWRFHPKHGLVGNSTILDSLAMLRRRGRACLAGWLGGLAPIADFNPLAQMASG